MIVPKGNSGQGIGRLWVVGWSVMHASVWVRVRLNIDARSLVSARLISTTSPTVFMRLMFLEVPDREIGGEGIVAKDARGALARAAHPATFVADRARGTRFSAPLPVPTLSHRGSHTVDRDLVNQADEPTGRLNLLDLPLRERADQFANCWPGAGRLRM